jgi:hypothetical protein
VGVFFIARISAPSLEPPVTKVPEVENRDEQARTLTRQEFCALERMSLSTYAKLRRLGRGPDEVRFPGMAFTRITPQARAEWHARIEEWRKSEAAELEKKRRSAIAKRAGERAAKSPLHVSKKRK